LKERFNSGIKYKGKNWKYDSLIQVKVKELAQFLLREPDHLDFVEPAPRLERSDSKELRKRILALTLQEARRLLIDKSTLHTIQEHARNEKPFKVYQKVASRLR
jgi:hypothetical protein